MTLRSLGILRAKDVPPIDVDPGRVAPAATRPTASRASARSASCRRAGAVAAALHDLDGELAHARCRCGREHGADGTADEG